MTWTSVPYHGAAEAADSGPAGATFQSTPDNDPAFESGDDEHGPVITADDAMEGPLMTNAFVGDSWRFYESNVVATDAGVSTEMTDTTPGLTVQVSVTLNEAPWGGPFTPTYEADSHRWVFPLDLPGPGRVAIKWLFTFGALVKTLTQSVNVQSRPPNVAVVGQSNLSWDIGPTGPQGPAGFADLTLPNALYVAKAGSAMTGLLTLSALFPNINGNAGYAEFRVIRNSLSVADHVLYLGYCDDTAADTIVQIYSDTTRKARFDNTQTILDDLAGTGTRAVRASASGVLSAVPLPQKSLSLMSGTGTITNIPAAETPLAGSSQALLGLVGYTEFRLLISVSLAGNAGSKVRVKDVTDSADLAASAGTGDVAISSTGVVVGAWVAIRAGSLVDSHKLQAYTVGGDAVADPQIGPLFIEVR